MSRRRPAVSWGTSENRFMQLLDICLDAISTDGAFLRRSACHRRMDVLHIVVSPGAPGVVGLAMVL